MGLDPDLPLAGMFPQHSIKARRLSVRVRRDEACDTRLTKISMGRFRMPEVPLR
ncbi:MAG TPA: hypothetical protein VF463_04180 [Sphingobium sp.]